RGRRRGTSTPPGDRVSGPRPCRREPCRRVRGRRGRDSARQPDQSCGDAGNNVRSGIQTSQTVSCQNVGPMPRLDELTLADIRRRVDTGAVSATELTKRYLARIESIDRGCPALNSVRDINPDARPIAARADAAGGARPGRRSTLHGVPILVKDNIATADRMMTTAG